MTHALRARSRLLPGPSFVGASSFVVGGSELPTSNHERRTNDEQAQVLASILGAHQSQGTPADAQAILAEHPELAANKSLVLDLIYEEYCQRREAGELAGASDLDAFISRFPSLRASLRRLIEAHQFLEANTHLLVEDEPPWPEPGETLLGFHLVSELGRGAFACAYLARELALGNRLVAVKVSRQGGVAEAETLGRLDHPNIVPVHSVQQDTRSGLTVICMPYQGRATLCDVLDRLTEQRAAAGLPPHAQFLLDIADCGLRIADSSEQAASRKPQAASTPDPVLARRNYVEGVVHLLAQLADALEHAHAQKIYHRDLKPSNVLLRPDGRPMLLDFNLSFDERQTNPRLGGTLPYMAPEQLRGLVLSPHDLRATVEDAATAQAPIDARADLYSLGVILYELVTGTHPCGPTPVQLSAEQVRQYLLDRQQAGPGSLCERNPQASRSLERVVQRCLAPDPCERFQSAAELAAALRDCLSPRRWVRRPVRLQLAAALVMLTAGLAGAQLLRPVDRDPMNRVDTVGRISNPSDTSGRNGNPSYASGPDEPEPESCRHFRKGWEFYQSRNYDEALPLLSQAVAADPNHGEAWFYRGLAHLQKEDWKSARADLKKAEELVSDARLLVCKGYCLNRLQVHRDALKAYEQAVAKGVHAASLWNNLGYSQYVAGGLEQFPAARQSLSRVIDDYPGDAHVATAYLNRARVTYRWALRQTEAIRKGTLGEEELAQLYEGIDDCREAFARGVVDTDLYYFAASLCAIASTQELPWFQEVRWRHEALGFGQLALEHGHDLGQIAADLTRYSQRDPEEDFFAQFARFAGIADSLLRDSQGRLKPAAPPLRKPRATADRLVDPVPELFN